MKCKFTNTLLIAGLMLMSSIMWSQSQSPLNIATRHIEQNYKQWNLTMEDISDLIVTDNYQSKKSRVTHIYFQQRHQGIALQTSMITVNVLEDGSIVHVSGEFYANLQEAVNTSSAQITLEQAMQKVLQNLQVTAQLPRAIEVDDNKYVYEKFGNHENDVIAELSYLNRDGAITLVWNVQIEPVGTSDMWEFQIDAQSGQILEKNDRIIRCTFDDNPYHNHDAHCRDLTKVKQPQKSQTVQEALTATNLMGGSYRVFPLPAESPAHGDHELVVDPALSAASPFGWHDTNGDDTPEYTITRGNNVYAYPDQDGDGGTDGNEPDGGAELLFDFPYNASGEAADNLDAATTNLFYMNNMLHDFTHAYGFDEVSGNFQRNTYGNGGAGLDEVLARAQAGSNTGSVNNANFGTPADGGNPSMNMFVWDQTVGGSGLLQVDAPSSISGVYETGVADFGPEVNDVPVSGEVVEVDDGTYAPYITDGCEDVVNSAEMVGKIALIDRGGCFFEQKAANAQAAGAIAVIICNFEDSPMGMAGVAEIDDPTIPTISISSIDCQTIRQFAGNGLNVTLVTPSGPTGPNFLDGDFDNGIIAHEFAHGISNRLTGGPSNVGCLGNGEQMGEGWSDFFSLVLTVKSGDTGDMRRGVGTYVTREENDGRGIRRFPYSTDMSISPLTYGDVAGNAGVHALGEVWCGMIWDLYWAMVDVYGFDEDQVNGTGGNNMAIQLVMEGMKMQSCSPSFTIGRDAILAADVALYNGDNQCLIWEVFARRGCGYSADDGDPNSGTDQTEAFDPLPTCIKEVKLTKRVTPLIEAGDEIEVTVVVINHKEDAVSGVAITDQLPEGTSYVDGSASIDASFVTDNGDNLVFAIGDMPTLAELTLTYKLSTDPNKFSARQFFDNLENINNLFWFSQPIAPVGGTDIWMPTTATANSGTTSYFVPDVATEIQQVLQAGQPADKIAINGDQPVLRFFHNYDTEGGADGGLIEVSNDDGTTWQQLGEDMFRGQYSGLIQYATFVIPNLSAFSGNSNGWVATYIDMSEYAGEEVIIRFNFATDDNTAVLDGGWFIDDLEIMDMVNYNGEMCVTTTEGDNVCRMAPERGTVIESQDVVDAVSNDPDAVAMNIFPNPASDQINVSITGDRNEAVTLSLMTLDGKEVRAASVRTSILTQTFTINTSDLPAGFYFVKASTDRGVSIEKVVIQ